MRPFPNASDWWSLKLRFLTSGMRHVNIITNWHSWICRRQRTEEIIYRIIKDRWDWYNKRIDGSEEIEDELWKKQEFILIGSRQQLGKAVTSIVNIKGEIMQKCRHIKYLGTDLDERLTFKDMINRKYRTAMGNLQKKPNIRSSSDHRPWTCVITFGLCKHTLPDMEVEKNTKKSEYSGKNHNWCSQIWQRPGSP